MSEEIFKFKKNDIIMLPNQPVLAVVVEPANNDGMMKVRHFESHVIYVTSTIPVAGWIKVGEMPDETLGCIHHFS